MCRGGIGQFANLLFLKLYRAWLPLYWQIDKKMFKSMAGNPKRLF